MLKIPWWKFRTTWAVGAGGAEGYVEHPRTELPTRLAEVENRRRQNEIILRLALLEAFMKEFHRAILRQKPSLLRSERTLPIGRMRGPRRQPKTARGLLKVE